MSTTTLGKRIRQEVDEDDHTSAEPLAGLTGGNSSVSDSAPGAIIDEQSVQDGDEDDADIGPMPFLETDAETTSVRKKRKGSLEPSNAGRFNETNIRRLVVLPHERLFLEHLPNADRYFKSFMHRDILTHVVSTQYESLKMNAQHVRNIDVFVLPCR
jgi:hypothetical protein